MAEVVGEFTVSSAGPNTVVDWGYEGGIDTMQSEQAAIMVAAAKEVVQGSPNINGVRIIFTEGRLDIG